MNEIRTRGRPKSADSGKAKDVKYRNLAVSAATQQSLDNVREITSATSDAEVFRRALRLYERILTAEGGVGEIEIKTRNGSKALLVD